MARFEFSNELYFHDIINILLSLSNLLHYGFRNNNPCNTTFYVCLYICIELT